jgi:hypothetical protein
VRLKTNEIISEIVIPPGPITTRLMNTLHPLNIIFRQFLCGGRSCM